MADGLKYGGRLSAGEVRRMMRLASANAGLWATGNGLVSTLLVIYLAADLGAQGIAISFILAAPRFAGLLRLAVPAIVARLQRRKAICLAAFVGSALVLIAVPLVAATGTSMPARSAMASLVAAWCAYHVLEYVGTVTLWSWLGDATPRRIRGRLLAERERWLTAGRVLGLVASASLAVVWRWLLPDAARWQPLALSAIIGAAFMIVAVVPLWMAPALSHMPSAVPATPWLSLVQALADPAYRRLIVFSCCFSVVNGIPAAAQELFPIRVLNASYDVLQGLRGLLRTGQFLIAPWMGRLVDRCGNRPVMIVCQLIVATGSLFYLAAAPDRWWLLVGAHLVWIAYAGLNVGLDNIKLKLAPAENNAPYVAMYQAASDFMNGVTIVVGGFLIDEKLRAGGSEALELYAQVFFWAWIGRTLVVGLLARLIEPGARELREILRGE